VGLHRLWLVTIFFRRRHVSPSGPDAGNLNALRRWLKTEASLPALHLGTVVGATTRPKCRLPKSFRLAPSTRLLLPEPPVQSPWLHTHAPTGVVRAECSVQVRPRTGMLRRCFTSFLFVSQFDTIYVDLDTSHCGSRAPKGLCLKAQRLRYSATLGRMTPNQPMVTLKGLRQKGLCSSFDATPLGYIIKRCPNPR